MPTNCVAPAPGKFYPRVWRPDGPERTESGLDRETTNAMIAIGLVAERLAAHSEVIHLVNANRAAFGFALRQTLILACTEVEANWASILRANGYPRQGRWNTND
jgi:hypothetical protein